MDKCYVVPKSLTRHVLIAGIPYTNATAVDGEYFTPVYYFNLVYYRIRFYYPENWLYRLRL